MTDGPLFTSIWEIFETEIDPKLKRITAESSANLPDHRALSAGIPSAGNNARHGCTSFC